MSSFEFQVVGAGEDYRTSTNDGRFTYDLSHVVRQVGTALDRELLHTVGNWLIESEAGVSHLIKGEMLGAALRSSAHMRSEGETDHHVVVDLSRPMRAPCDGMTYGERYARMLHRKNGGVEDSMKSEEVTPSTLPEPPRLSGEGYNVLTAAEHIFSGTNLKWVWSTFFDVVANWLHRQAPQLSSDEIQRGVYTYLSSSLGSSLYCRFHQVSDPHDDTVPNIIFALKTVHGSEDMAIDILTKCSRGVYNLAKGEGPSDPSEWVGSWVILFSSELAQVVSTERSRLGADSKDHAYLNVTLRKVSDGEQWEARAQVFAHNGCHTESSDDDNVLTESVMDKNTVVRGLTAWLNYYARTKSDFSVPKREFERTTKVRLSLNPQSDAKAIQSYVDGLGSYMDGVAHYLMNAWEIDPKYSDDVYEAKRDHQVFTSYEEWLKAIVELDDGAILSHGESNDPRIPDEEVTITAGRPGTSVEYGRWYGREGKGTGYVFQGHRMRTVEGSLLTTDPQQIVEAALSDASYHADFTLFNTNPRMYLDYEEDLRRITRRGDIVRVSAENYLSNPTAPKHLKKTHDLLLDLSGNTKVVRGIWYTYGTPSNPEPHGEYYDGPL